MCLLDPHASQVHRHELHMSHIYGDMKQRSVNRDSSAVRAMALTFIRIIMVCFSCELITHLPSPFS